uniref:Xaa-Pro aminopeptidase 1-like n=1 Tax=Saccoglossus kowalevskii TaxID=10224 RepID=A0ABM0MQN4_SACKO
IKQYSEDIPIQRIKAIKNEHEVNGMKEGYLQDAAAKIQFLHWIQNEVKSGRTVTELSGDIKLREFREKQPDFVMPSFGSISAFGPNGAVIHYKSTEETDVAITDKDLYLLDSGGQYKCGATTDTTRTMHFGTPADRHKVGKHIDALPRQHLWNNGWNYNHGTGHGIGAMLNVHEGSFNTRTTVPLVANVFMSDEPGYYEDNDYGVRLETVVMVVEAETKYNFGDATFFTFEEVSFVPFDPKLIKYELMSERQIEWLNDYNIKIREKVGPRIKDVNPEAYEWMLGQTEQVVSDSDSQRVVYSGVILAVQMFCVIMMV